MKRVALTALVFTLLPCAVRAQHMGDMLIGSTAAGSGALAIVYDFGQRIRVTESASGGGNTLYTTTDPGWDLVLTATSGVFPLTSGIPVSVLVTAIDPGVSMKIGATTLNTVGQSKLLGTSPTIHVHPSWQLVLPTGTQAERSVSFRLTTTASGYTHSSVFTAILSNTTTSTTTTTSSTTATTTTTSAASTSTSLAPTTTTTASSSTTTTVPGMTDELRTARTLVLSERSGRPERRALFFLSKDRMLTIADGNGGAADPTIAGGSLRVSTATGDGFDTSYVLPAEGWTLIGKPGEHKGYRYSDRRRLHGPVTSAVVKTGKQLRIAAKGAALGHTLATDPDPVAVTLTLGTHRYCFVLGGATRFKAGRSYKATEAPAPLACAP